MFLMSKLSPADLAELDTQLTGRAPAGRAWTHRLPRPGTQARSA